MNNKIYNVILLRVIIYFLRITKVMLHSIIFMSYSESRAYNLFKDYTNKLKEKETKFNSLYEPLNLCDLKETYEWLNSWPWEVKNV